MASRRPSPWSRATRAAAPRAIASTAAPRSPASASRATSAPPAAATSERETSGSTPTGSLIPASISSVSTPCSRTRSRRNAYSCPLVSNVPSSATIGIVTPVLAELDRRLEAVVHRPGAAVRARSSRCSSTGAPRRRAARRWRGRPVRTHLALAGPSTAAVKVVWLKQVSSTLRGRGARSRRRDAASSPRGGSWRSVLPRTRPGRHAPTTASRAVPKRLSWLAPPRAAASSRRDKSGMRQRTAPTVAMEAVRTRPHSGR